MEKLKEVETGVLAFWCPACQTGHAIRLDVTWTITGTEEAPTVRPGIVIEDGAQRCYVFITAGMLDYKADCGHDYAWKTAKMENL